MLGRPLWPVLDAGQDPESLEARVAFHLHRLKLVGEPLRNTGFVPSRYLGLLTKARVPLTSPDVEELARRLHTAAEDISRPLTKAESDEWAFYRYSAANLAQVWEHAQALWKAAGLTNADAARILDINYRTLSRCLAHEDPFALSFDGAQKLCGAIGLPGPTAFIDGPLDRDDENASR